MLQPATASSVPVTVPARPHWAVAALLFGAVWLALFNHLRVEWSVNPQYNYGWGVPLLAAYLFSRRWTDRPEPSPSSLNAGLLAAFALSALLLLPANLFQEANPDWRLVNWAVALLGTELTLAGVWFVGGWPWLRHFAVPIAFLLLAVPWPTTLENSLIQNLMRAVAAVTVEVLNFLGVLARQRGNLIELPAGIVGINEACSGVRSFQSTVMISLFLGELYRFTWPRRFALLGGGVVLAFALNLGRSFFLTWLCVRNGTSATHAWHDPAGYVVFGLSFAGLLGLSFWLRGRRMEPPEDQPPPAGRPRAFAKFFLVAFGVWLLLVAFGTEGWYRWHERGARPSAGWSVAWPDDTPQFKPQPISEETRRILRYSDGSSASWLNNEGTRWTGFFFRWEPGRGSTQLARSHAPEVCMPASGLQLAAEHGVDSVTVNRLEIPFRAYTFTRGGQPLFIFFCVWEDQVLTEAPDLGRRRATVGARVRAVREGRRHLGQQVLQVVVAGPPDIDSARRQLVAELPRLIRPAPAS